MVILKIMLLFTKLHVVPNPHVFSVEHKTYHLSIKVCTDFYVREVFAGKIKRKTLLHTLFQRTQINPHTLFSISRRATV